MSKVTVQEPVLTWRQRIGVGHDFPLHAPNDVERAMEAEIADLRAYIEHAGSPAAPVLNENRKGNDDAN